VARIGCSYVIVAVGLTALGIAFAMAGIQLAPQDSVAANEFRTDPSCTAAFSGGVRPGACSVVNAMVLVTAERRGGGFTRTPSETPYVSVRYADGTIHQDDLDGGAGTVFALGVHSGAPARVQLYRGTFVRIIAEDTSAETISAPDVNATDDSEMPWVGAVLIVIAGLFVWGGLRAGRRAAAVPPRS
jgi:hypothetical protein